MSKDIRDLKIDPAISLQEATSGYNVDNITPKDKTTTLTNSLTNVVDKDVIDKIVRI